MRVGLLLVIVSLFTVVPGCGGSGVPKEMQAPPQEPLTPDNPETDGPEGTVAPMDPF